MKKKNYQNVYQFKIILKNSKPPIWRRIQVPESYSFWDLHVAIQDAMGWLDYHLHQFMTIDTNNQHIKYIGIPDETGYTEVLPSWDEKIKDWFPKLKKMNYEYDFGDGWEHFVILEKILPRDNSVKYPVCIKGKMACPPEDCGGIWGYYDMLEIIKNPKRSEYNDMVEWLGDDKFDLEKFDVNEIKFDDPTERLKLMKESH